MKSEAKEFLSAMCPTLPEDQRMILCGFPGDPNKAEHNAWKPKPWKPGGKIGMPKEWNVYVTIGSFRIADDRTWRRRKSLFAAGHALMVDDVGTGPGAKVDPGIIQLQPSAVVETSPENFQYWYFLDEPETDPYRFDAIIRAFITSKLLGNDPGMSGITRVGRIPGYANCKEKYGGWTSKLTALSYVNYTTDALINQFGLELKGRNAPVPRPPTEESIRRNRAFVDIYKWLQRHQMLKKDEPDASGWTEMTCPWVDHHTGGVDNGAAICEPAEENAWHGAFRCHHGHCLEKGWRHLAEWIGLRAAENLDAINSGRHEFDIDSQGRQR